MTPVHPVTLNLVKFESYDPHSLLEVVQQAELKFTNSKKTQAKFKNTANELYIPLFNFLYSQKIKLNLVVSGDFLQTAAKYEPKLIRLIRKMEARKQLNIVADAFYGNSLTCLYNISWWVESVGRTVETITELFEIECDTVFIPQLYRSLELEKVYWDLGVRRFLSREKTNKSSLLQTKLSELRRFDGQNAYWITPEKDTEIEIYFIADNRFHEVNNVVFSHGDSNARVLGLEIALAEAKEPSQKKWPEHPSRVSEHYSLVLYNHLQRAVIRLWEYGSILISTESRNSTKTDNDKLRREFAALQNVEFLRFLKKNVYQDHNLDFSSPYEAFASMQAAVKKVEILLQNKI
ncbi:MAG: hypothetical protein OHK0017_00140 [Patescibacteria group bacterium]